MPATSTARTSTRAAAGASEAAARWLRPILAVAAAAGILLGGLGAIGALARGAGRKKTIPFGPFLAAGAVVAAFLGNQISDAYLGLLG